MAEKELEYYLAQARRIAQHREKDAEKEIRKQYKELLKDLQHFMAEEYAALAEDDKLTYEILHSKAHFARFIEEIEQRVNVSTPAASVVVENLVKDTYKVAWEGMNTAVAKANTPSELKEMLKGLRSVSPEVIQKAVENPVSGLTLKDTLEKNRKNIIYDIKQQVGIGLSQGDRYSTMAKRIAKSVDGDYQKAIRIARTESHRVQEAGFLDSANEIDTALKDGVTDYRMTKTWKTMQDERVRNKYGANHAKMDGVTIGIDEEFDLGNGVKTLAPSQSGSAKNDINCRCYLSYKLASEKPQPKKVQRKVVDGKDISSTWERRPDDYDFEIEDVINAQGYDGLPKVVSKEEFDKAVKESNFIAQRTYSAPDQETLDAYRDELYNGKWYVDCSTGGAQYGQGMYCAADYTGTITDGIKAEMKHYQELNNTKFRNMSSVVAKQMGLSVDEYMEKYGVGRSYIETLTLDKSAKIVKYSDLFDEFSEYKVNVGKEFAEKEISRLSKSFKGVSGEAETYMKYQMMMYDIEFGDVMEAHQKLTAEQVGEMNKLVFDLRENATKKIAEANNMNIGSFASLRGYDAINAEGHGASGSYTVILNRTKCIILGE